MAASAGPDIVEDGLVLYLDGANSNNPTKNLVASPNSINIAQSSGTITTNDAISLPPYIAAESPTTDAADLVTSGSWIAHTSTGTTQGKQYMCSWVVKGYEGVTSVRWNWGGAHSGNRTNFTVNLTNGSISNITVASGESYYVEELGDGWYRLAASSTITNGPYCYPQLDYVGSVGGIYLCGCQFEEGPELTPFTYSNRPWKNLVNENLSVDLINGPGQSSDNLGIISFDGIDDYCNIGSTISLGNQFTIMAMIRLSGTNSDTSIFGSSANGHDNWFGLNSNRVFLYATQFTDVNNFGVAGTTTLDTTDSVWYHVGATVNIDTVKLYVNGIQEATNTRPYTIGGWTSTGAIGRRGAINQRYFKGSIAKLMTYNTVLTPQEILQNYNATKSRFYDI